MAGETVIAKISGCGYFPMDMLRYDSCSPATESDSYLIANTLRDFGKWEVYVKRTSRVTKAERKRDQLADWTVGRWHSFGVRIEHFDCCVPPGGRRLEKALLDNSSPVCGVVVSP